MRIGIHGYCKGRVPKAVLDDFEMHTGGHEHGGVGVAETVEGESSKTDAVAVDGKLLGDIVLRQRPFCFPVPGEDKRRCAPPVSQLHFVAVCFLAAEYSHCSLINGDGPSRTGRLQVRRYNPKKTGAADGYGHLHASKFRSIYYTE